MKRILLCTDGSTFSQSSYHYATWLAPRLDAHVNVLHITDIRSQKVVSTGNLSGSIGIDASRELLDKLVNLEHEKAKINHQRAKLILEEAKHFFEAEGIQNVNLIHETGFLVDSFHEFEAQADLIILGKRGEAAEFASGHLGANLERIVRASHKPCLITSRQFKPIERVLLAYDGSPSCQRMLRFLTKSAVFRGLGLYIITVAKNADDQTAIARIGEAKHQAQTAGFEPVCCLIGGNPETVIAHYARENNISLLAMGAYGHSRIRHLVIGSTTAQLLRSSHIPILLFR